MLPPVMAPRLTEEQERVVEEALSRQHLKVIAFAGAGKTFTLQQVAKALKETFPHLRILYLTFNRSLAEEARHKFQGYAEVRTNHALALAHYRHRQRWARMVPSLPQVKSATYGKAAPLPRGRASPGGPRGGKRPPAAASPPPGPRADLGPFPPAQE